MKKIKKGLVKSKKSKKLKFKPKSATVLTVPQVCTYTSSDPEGRFPFVATKTPNGQPIPTTNCVGLTFFNYTRSYGYVFAPNPTLDLADDHLRSLAKNLEVMRFANVGHVFLMVSNSLVGVPRIRSFSFAWDDTTNSLTLWIKKATMEKGKEIYVALGQFCSTESYLQWQEVGGEWTTTQFNPPPKHDPVERPLQDPVVYVSKAIPFSPVENLAKIPVEKNGTKYKVFGLPVTNIIRWMGADAWTEEDARTVLDLLGLQDVKRNTIVAQLRDGRNGGKVYGDIPKLTGDQADQLNKVIEIPIPKPEEKTKMKNTWKSKAPAGTGIGGKESKKPKVKVVPVGTNREARRAAKKIKKGGK